MTTITIPASTLEQRLDALDQANRVRSARASLRRSLRSDPEDARRVLLRPSAEYRGLRLALLLEWMPGVGRAKVDRFLLIERINPRKTIAGLSDRQREAALSFVSAHIERRREVGA